MTSTTARYLLFVTLLSTLAGCTAPATFVLPGLDSRADATDAQTAPSAVPPRYRYGSHPYGAYYGAYGYGNVVRTRDVPAGQAGTPGATSGTTAGATPGPITAEPPPRPREIEAPTREVRRVPTRAAENSRPVPRQLER
jgi:hypothetical protein